MIGYHPGSRQAMWEYKNPTNKEAERKSLKGAGCRGGNAAHPRQQMWLDKALACLPLALGCMAGVAPPHGNLSPSSAANRVGAEPTAGEQCVVLQPLSARAAQNALIRESCWWGLVLHSRPLAQSASQSELRRQDLTMNKCFKTGDSLSFINTYCYFCIQVQFSKWS